MAKASVIYQVNEILYLRHPKDREGITYAAIFSIKDQGKNPCRIKLKFIPPYPFIGVMPPEEHQISAATPLDIFIKLQRWAKKYGYSIY